MSSKQSEIESKTNESKTLAEKVKAINDLDRVILIGLPSAAGQGMPVLPVKKTIREWLDYLRSCVVVRSIETQIKITDEEILDDILKRTVFSVDPSQKYTMTEPHDLEQAGLTCKLEASIRDVSAIHEMLTINYWRK